MVFLNNWEGCSSLNVNTTHAATTMKVTSASPLDQTFRTRIRHLFGLGTGGSVAWLFPGLLLLGAGQGLCITPLTTTVLSHADPVTAGSVAGALSTAQQVGNSVGVAVTGVLFFGALGHGYGLAFERSVLQMGALLLVVAALTRLMPGRQRAA